jgi:biopolymer transport protein ExbB/TolQ
VSHDRNLIRSALRSPWVWGGLVTGGFYYAIYQHQMGGEWAFRYFAGHWVLWVTTAMFFVGMAIMVLKALDVWQQLATLKKVTLGPLTEDGLEIDECEDLLEQAKKLPGQGTYAVQRLIDGLAFVQRSQSADRIEDELKFLADADAGRQHGGYALVRLLITCTPLMGFLGTVIGITMAIAEISPQQLIDNPQSVTAGLAVAFDTTALAIALSLVLLLVQLLVDKFEGRLLSAVDELAVRELAGRFATMGSGGDPHLAAVRRMSDAVVDSAAELVVRQAEIWQNSIVAAEERWAQTAASLGAQLELGLQRALTESLAGHAAALAKAEASAIARQEAAWQDARTSLASAAESAQKLHAEVSRQGEVLLQVVEATGQVARLEEALNRNLAAISGAAHFSETMLSLSATLNLLAARLGAEERPVTLKRLEGHAA